MRRPMWEDRKIVATFYVSDGPLAVETHHVTEAGTVVRLGVGNDFVSEHDKGDCQSALAFAIEQTGWANVVDNLRDYLSDD